MEGNAPSMGAFVLAVATFGNALEAGLKGVETPDVMRHKVKAFADDNKKW